MKNKRDLLYKCLMSLVIAFFVAALYFNSVYVAERRFGQKTGSGDAEPDGGAGGKLDFTLLDQSGKGTKFTEFRGNIVFMVFWKQSNNDSYDLINLLIEKLPDSADVNNGKTGIALISVLVPDENDIPDTGGNTGAPQVSTGTPQDYQVRRKIHQVRRRFPAAYINISIPEAYWQAYLCLKTTRPHMFFIRTADCAVTTEA